MNWREKMKQIVGPLVIGISIIVTAFIVNPVPRLYRRGLGEEPCGKTFPIHPCLHRQGFLWYGVNQ